MKEIGKIVVNLCILVGIILMSSILIRYGYNLFIVDVYQLKPLSLYQAVEISMFISIFKLKNIKLNEEAKTTEENIINFIKYIFVCLFYMLLCYIISKFK